mgnify:CR=1 FL=1
MFCPYHVLRFGQRPLCCSRAGTHATPLPQPIALVVVVVVIVIVVGLFTTTSVHIKSFTLLNTTIVFFR